MKNILALLVCLALALCCAVSLAEEGKTVIGDLSINGAFTLQCGLPEGYEIQPTKVAPEQVTAVIRSEDPLKPVMQLSVAFDDLYWDVDRLNDLSDEELAVLERTFTDVDPTIEITYGDTGLGTRLLIARQSSTTPNYIDFLSIYKGYFVEFVLVPSMEAEDTTLTDEQLSMCIDFLTDLDFVPSDALANGGRTFDAGTYTASLTDYNQESGTLQAQIRLRVELDPAMVQNLKAGDTLDLGTETLTVETLQTDEYGDILVNDDLYLIMSEDKVLPQRFDSYLLETAGTLNLKVPDDLVFLDFIDPETGSPLDEPTEHTAQEFISMFLEGGYPDFASDNVEITLDENGGLAGIARRYVPWQ